MSAPMTTVIATITMTRTRPDGVTVPITINLGVPAPAPPDWSPGGWYCPIQFSKEVPVLSDETYCFYGEYSMEALIYAITSPGILLQTLPFANEIDFSNLTNFGFPVMASPTGVALDPEGKPGEQQGQQG